MKGLLTLKFDYACHGAFAPTCRLSNPRQLYVRDLYFGMEQRPYFPALDGLRALAVLFVFFHHYLADFLPASLRFGWIGVDVFFVLSGFLITGILFDTRHAPRRWHDFYLRRTLRIFPLFYGILLLLLITTPLLHWNWSWAWLSMPGYFFNMMMTTPGHPEHTVGHLIGRSPHGTYVELSLPHFWTLCVEEQFYLLWPAVVFLVKDRRTLLRVTACIIPAILVLRCAVFFEFHSEYAIYLLAHATYARADSLMVGAAIALLLRGTHAKRVMAWGGRMLTVSLVLFCLLRFVAVRYLHQSISSEQDTSWIVTIGFSMIAFAAAGLLLLSLRPMGVFSRLLQWTPLRWLGQRSYGFYIFHMIWIEPTLVAAEKLLRRVGMNVAGSAHRVELTQTAIAFALTLAVSATSYRWFEQPFLHLKDRWTHQPQGSATKRILHNERVA